MILASAMVDKLRDGPVPLWTVYVWGGLELSEGPEGAQHRRTYSIAKSSDTLAAQEGIARFVDEIDNLTLV